MKKNVEIRNLIQIYNLKYWQVADKLGITDGNFSRVLRYELSDEAKEKVINVIKKLKEEIENV